MVGPLEIKITKSFNFNSCLNNYPYEHIIVYAKLLGKEITKPWKLTFIEIKSIVHYLHIRRVTFAAHINQSSL